ncbi:Methyltransferase type 12 [sediment metagenome]|uniref:Methyltransferase type 12 n=1 Tax=sediment metagenome TaxID=749907 RepID=D9PN92_9ZZZZ
MSKPSPEKRVGEWYGVYDLEIKRICPDYEMGLDAVAKNLSLHSATKVLELGCGTGNLSARILSRCREVKLVGVDNNEQMLEQARVKLKTFADRVNLIHRDVTEVDLTGFEQVVSSLLFHLLSKEKRDLLFERIIHSKVREVIVFDRVKGETSTQEKKNLQSFARNLSQHEIAGVLYQALVKESRANQPLSLSELKNIFAYFHLKVIYQNPQHGFTGYKLARLNY